MRDAVAKESLGSGHHTIALLGTKYLIEGDFYSDRLRELGVTSIKPTEEQTERLQFIIFSELTRGVVTKGSRAYLREVASSCLERGASIVGLCCTEFGMLMSEDRVVPGDRFDQGARSGVALGLVTAAGHCPARATTLSGSSTATVRPPPGVSSKRMRPPSSCVKPDATVRLSPAFELIATQSSKGASTASRNRFRHSRSAVDDEHLDVVADDTRLDGDRLVGRTESTGVAHHVRDDALNEHRVGHQRRQFARDVALDRASPRVDVGDGARDHGTQLHCLRVDDHLSRFEASRVDEVDDQSSELTDLARRRR